MKQLAMYPQSSLWMLNFKARAAILRRCTVQSTIPSRTAAWKPKILRRAAAMLDWAARSCTQAAGTPLSPLSGVTSTCDSSRCVLSAWYRMSPVGPMHATAEIMYVLFPAFHIVHVSPWGSTFSVGTLCLLPRKTAGACSTISPSTPCF